MLGAGRCLRQQSEGLTLSLVFPPHLDPRVPHGIWAASPPALGSLPLPQLTSHTISTGFQESADGCGMVAFKLLATVISIVSSQLP